MIRSVLTNPVLFIAYDLKNGSERYEELDKKLKELNATWEQRTVWSLHSSISTDDLKKILLPLLKKGDKLLVIEGQNFSKNY